MKKVLFVLLALSLFVPVACGKGGGMVDDVKKVLQKATADIEALSKQLDEVKGPEELAKLQEQSQKFMMEMGASMAELQKKHGDKEPSADDHKALAEDLAKMQAAGAAFEKKANEIAAKLSGGASDAGEGEGEGEGEGK